MNSPAVDPQPNVPRLEQEVLEYWAEDGTFRASVEAREPGPDGADEYVFYDGPPFANGRPHYGHLLTGYVKDAVPRYQTMRGRRVERRFGWDCHGLPAEIETERELGVTGRKAIQDYGVGRFNQACRTSVLRYTHEWERYVTRQARWVDFANDYKTLDLSYMESVMWAFKQLWDKGLVYEGTRVLPYCWECETPLSNTETRMDDAYRERRDPAVTVGFELDGGQRLLVWTTTPWTLPSNLAIAVGTDIVYAVYERDGVELILAEAAVPRYGAEFAEARRVGTLTGADLVGRGYRPLFGFFAGTPNAFQILADPFVSTEEGTGAVHLAPGFGEDDQRIGEAHGIGVVCPVDDRGRFTDAVPDYVGIQVFDANRGIIRALRERGMLLREDSYLHSYPHCWRSGTALIYKAVDSWFVRVTAIRDRMLELNQHITWVPEHVRDGAFGSWLANARDWSISRNRFWGSPIPVWRSDDPRYPRIDVYGSLDELERDFGVRPNDLHRPAIDTLTRPNPDDPTGRSTMRRVDTVLDCWFESGSMPFAQVHYPFENREWFEEHYPADFIVEYIGQTRGWFYTLHVLATALFDRPPFRACVAHGIVLGDDGQKMSKSRRNYPDPLAVFDRYGSDPMRWFLLCSSILRGGDLIVTEQGVTEASRSVVNPIWSAWHFFALYAKAAGVRPRRRTSSTQVLDRYVLARTRALVDDVTAAMDRVDLPSACAAIRGYLDALTNWYIRRSRDRFWSGDQDGFDTLSTVLEVLCRVAAPLLPMVTEAVYRGLTGRRSVHLTDWPDPSALPADAELIADMDLAREVCSAALSLREQHGLRVRLPLPALTVATPEARRLAPLAEVIADELNVKQVHLVADTDALTTYELRVDPRAVGPRLGPATQKVLAAARRGEWERDGEDAVVVAGERLLAGEFNLRLSSREAGATRPLPAGRGLVQLDTAPTPELEAEGLARDLIRLVQVARKDAGLQVSDRISLRLAGPDDVVRAAEGHRDLIAAETLAVDLTVNGDTGAVDQHRLPDGRHVTIDFAARGQASDGVRAAVGGVENGGQVGGETDGVRGRQG